MKNEHIYDSAKLIQEINLEYVKLYKEGYEEGDIEKCKAAIISLIIAYTNLEQDSHFGIKKLLFSTNCVKSPLSYKYCEGDYKKTMSIFFSIEKMLLKYSKGELADGITVPPLNIKKCVIEDLRDIVLYTELLYKMSRNNMERIESSSVEQVPFTEELLSIILFYQDQMRLIVNNVPSMIKGGMMTGMEAVISDSPVSYYEGLTSSIADSNEADLESINELILYMYYKNRNTISEKVELHSIDYSKIHPYENPDFERLKIFSAQSQMLNRIEEGFRYGFFKYAGWNRVETNKQKVIDDCKSSKTYSTDDIIHLITISEDERYRAHKLGNLRRQKEVRTTAAIDIRSWKCVERAEKKIKILSEGLLSIQLEGNMLLDLSNYHPDKEVFLLAEGVTSIKTNLVKLFTKQHFLDADRDGIKVSELIQTFKYFSTLSEIVNSAALRIIDLKRQETIVKQLVVVEIDYFVKELQRLCGFKEQLARKLTHFFVLNHDGQSNQDIFANPLVKISKTQVILSQALWNQVNLDRVIEMFLSGSKTNNDMGKVFEKEIIKQLSDGYVLSDDEAERKPIPGLKVNRNEVKFKAYDNKDIEFDGILILKNYLVLIEMKSLLVPYELEKLESRRKHINEAKRQLLRRRESVKKDWDEIRRRVSIDLPDRPYDDGHIMLIACTDVYDYTPLYEDEVYITDDSTLLRFFTKPYLEAMIWNGNEMISEISYLWKNGSPSVRELKRYLRNPDTVKLFEKVMKKEFIPVYRFDEKDLQIVCEEYHLLEDPVRAYMEGK